MMSFENFQQINMAGGQVVGWRAEKEMRLKKKGALEGHMKEFRSDTE